MTQDERWNARYKEVMEFLEREHRNPSKYRIEEHDMLNWMKQQRKLVNAGEMAEPRLGQFMELLELSNRYKRVNQYQ